MSIVSAEKRSIKTSQTPHDSRIGKNETFLWNLTIDFVIINPDKTNKQQFQNYFNTFSSLSTSIRHYKTKNPKYNKVTKFDMSYDNSVYKVYFMRPNKSYLPKLLIKVLQPDDKLFRFLHDLFHSGYKLSFLEFAFDCYTPLLKEFYQFIKSRLYLKWPGADFNPGYVSTTYFNNIRKSATKGVRVYIKEVNHNRFVRIEIVYKRRLLKRMGINTIEDLFKIKTSAVTKYLRLMIFDYELFRKRCFSRRGSNGVTFRELDTIIENIDTLIERKSIRAASEYARNFAGCSCLKEHEQNDKFWEVINNKSFL